MCHWIQASRHALALMGLSLSLASLAADKAPPLQKDYPLDQITPTVFVIHGPLETPSPANQGFMNNPGFVLTDAGVVVIDPGSSVQAGEMVLRKVAEKTKQPVVAVLNTHVHGDHWLGNHAIRQAFPQAKIYGHPIMIEMIKQGEGKVWLDFMLNVTNGATAGTEIVSPEQPLQHGDTVKIGSTTFKVHHHSQGHTNNDLMFEVENVLFCGDTVVSGVLARMDDGDFKANIEAIDLALKLKLQHYVPGHGKSGGAEVPQKFRDYLHTVYSGVAKYYPDGLSDFEIKEKLQAEMLPWTEWARFSEQFGKHVSLAYLQIEQAGF